MATSTPKRKNASTIPAVLASTQQPNAVTEFRKANDSIGLRVVEGKFSLLSRKLFNVFVHKAQKTGAVGRETPPSDDPVFKEYFWIPMGEVIKNTEFNSNNYALIKDEAKELLNIRVLVEAEKTWTDERLVSSIKIHNTAGLKSKGGEVWLGFAFPPEVMSMVLNPNKYTKFNLHFQTALRSNPSLGLYEVCRRYATSPSQVTKREPWETWYHVLSGNAISEAVPEFKYFKRDILKPAIAEVSAVTDIEVEVIEFTKGRKILDLQFRVKLKQQKPLDLGAGTVLDADLIERIMRLGISKQDAATITLSYDDHVVKATLEMVDGRMQSKNGAALESPAAYFKDAIKKGYATVAAVAKPVKELKAPASPKRRNIREQFVLARAQEALGYFRELSHEEQRAHLDEFIQVADKSLKPHMKKGLESQVFTTSFSDWLATKLWGAVTDAQIIEYMDAERIGGLT